MHHHLCPRQVLGVRMGMWAGELLGLNLPQAGKRLYAIVETDGCAVDGIAVATNCWVGHRTLRIEDYGKVAATFLDTATGEAVRIAPSPRSRELALAHALGAASRWEAQLAGYQQMPAQELLVARPVRVCTPVEQIVGCAGKRAVCACCGEEIMNGREVVRGQETLCASCAGPSYYATVPGFSRPAANLQALAAR